MKRLLATIRRDLRVQRRNGFYYAAAFVAAIMIVLAGQLRNLDLALLLPVFIFSNILINTFYFMAALVLLEKGEGSLESIVVTPLRKWEYLASKLITLIFLSVVESFMIVLLVYGAAFNWLLLLGGIIVLGTMYALLGFIFVARYDSINEFLFPSVLLTVLLAVPVLGYFGIWSSPLLYLHPFQAPLVILRASFIAVPAWELAYGFLYGALWILILFTWALRVFDRFVILQVGARA